MVIITENFINQSQILNSVSAQVQLLLAASHRFAVVMFSDNAHGLEIGLYVFRRSTIPQKQLISIIITLYSNRYRQK